MYKKLLKNKFLILLSVLFLLLRLPSLFEPYWYGDEAIYLVLGQAIRKGLSLYGQIHDNKPPTLYYLAAISQSVFGFRFLLMLFMVPTIYFFHKLSKIFFTEKNSKLATLLFLILTSIPYFEGNIANAEVFMLLPTILALYLFSKKYLLSKKTQNPVKTLIFSGLLLGLAFTIKIPVAVEFAFLSLWIIIENFFSISKIKQKIIHLIIFSFSFLFPILILTVYFYFKGVIKQFLVASLFQNFGYLSSWSTGTHSSSFASGGVLLRFVVLLFFWILIFILKNKKIISKNLSFILFWFSATIFGSLLSGRPYPHYLIQSLPPLVLILISILDLKKYKKNIFPIFSVFFFIFVIIKYNFYFYPVFKYYSNFYSYAIRQKTTEEYRSFFGYQINDIYRVSSFIQSNTDFEDKIFIWSDYASIYALSDRLPASKYTVAYHIIDFNGYELTMNKIKTYLPKYIVYYQMDNRPFTELDDFISNYYYAVEVFGEAIIFKLR